MSKNKTIPNPNAITTDEKLFLQNKTKEAVITHDKKIEYKNIMVSMPNDFLYNLDTFIKTNPTEGSRSSLIVRVVAEYVKQKTDNI